MVTPSRSLSLLFLNQLEVPQPARVLSYKHQRSYCRDVEEKLLEKTTQQRRKFEEEFNDITTHRRMADTDRKDGVEVASPGSPVELSHSHYTTITTTTEPTHHIYGTRLELHTIIPVCGALLVFLILVLCLRYRIYSSSYKQWLKRLRRASSRGNEGDTVSVDEEMFKPPPTYETAINMPKPCSNCQSKHELGGDLKHCPCNNRTPSDGDTQKDICLCKIETKTESDSGEEQNTEISRQTASSDTCTLTLHLDSNSSELTENRNGPYVILEQVQRMARDPNAATNSLPTYQDYIEEFPDQIDYV